MKKISFAIAIAILLIPTISHAQSLKAKRIRTNTTNFNNILSTSDDNTQKALDTIDNITATSVDALKRDGSNANQNIDIGTYDFAADNLTLTGVATISSISGNLTIGGTVTATGLYDADLDTSVRVESTPDRDIIDFYEGGEHLMEADGGSVFFNPNRGDLDFEVGYRGGGINAIWFNAGTYNLSFNGPTTFNQNRADVDFSIRKSVAGNAYNYNAGTDIHTFMGNVGIGIASPVVELDIIGGVGISGNLTIDGTTQMASDLTLTGSTSGLYVGDGDIAKFEADNVNVDSGTLYVDSVNNRVGIGTTDPGFKLYVNGDARVNRANIIGFDAGDGTSARAGIGSNTDNDMIFKVGANAEIMRLTADGAGAGNVGIGTTSPGAKLAVSGDASITSDLTVDGSTLYVNSTLNRVGIGTTGPSYLLELSSTEPTLSWVESDTGVDWRLRAIESTFRIVETGVADLMTFKEGGNVGIGTTAPSAKLDVVGDATVSSDLTVGGTSFLGDNGVTNYVRVTDSGVVSLHGLARVTRHLRVGAAQWGIGAGAPTKGFEGVWATLDFDNNVDDDAHFAMIVPHRWDNTVDIEFAVDWFYDGGGSPGTIEDAGTVCWALQYLGCKAGEDTTAAGTTIAKTSAGNHNSDRLVRTTFTTKILATNLEAGDTLGFRLYRDVDGGGDAGDTMTEDARLINTHFHFTMNKLGEQM